MAEHEARGEGGGGGGEGEGEGRNKGRELHLEMSSKDRPSNTTSPRDAYREGQAHLTNRNFKEAIHNLSQVVWVFCNMMGNARLGSGREPKEESYWFSTLHQVALSFSLLAMRGVP